MHLNSVQLVGRIVRDPQLRKGAYGDGWAFTIVTTYKGKSEKSVEEVTYINCIAWPRGDEGYEFLKDGALVFITGRLKQSKWKSSLDGKDMKQITIQVDSLIFNEKLAFDIDDKFTAKADENVDELPF